MVAYSAVSFLPKGAEKAQLGTVKVESDTVVAVSERLVRSRMSRSPRPPSPRSIATSSARS
jgi:hypothetical protein